MKSVNKLTFWQYFKINKQTTISCLKICSILFSVIATGISLAVSFAKGSEEDPFIVFIACELFGYGFAAFIFMLAISEGYNKARKVVDQYYSIPENIRESSGLKLNQKPLNPKYWFMQFEIVRED
ncbi:MAG: hypothetical protein AAFQ94_24825 [Bacteroidota bacterium]